MKITLARAIAGGTVLAAVLSLTAIGGYSHYSTRRALLDNARIIMAAHTRNVEQQTRLLLAPVPSLADSMAEVTRVAGDPLHQQEYAYRFLVEKLKNLPTVYSVYWADTEGRFFLVGRRPLPEDPNRNGYFLRTLRVYRGQRVVEESWYSSEDHTLLQSLRLADDPYDPRTRPWFKTAIAAGGPAWSAPYLFYITGKPGITYAIPLYRGGELTGVCAVDMETESLSKYLQQILPTPDSRIFVLDPSSSRLIGFSDLAKMADSEDLQADDVAAKRFGEKVVAATASLVRPQGEEESGSGTIEIEGKVFHSQVKSATIEGLPIAIGLAIPNEELFAPLDRSRGMVLGFSLVIMIAVTGAGLLFARAVARPMEGLRRAARQIEERRFDQPLAMKTPFEEIEVTFSAFRQMQASMKEYLEKAERLNETLQGAHLESLYRLAVAAEFKDRDTATHLNRVAAYSREIARLRGASDEDVEILFHASLMHDVGKIGIPDEILMKPKRYTDEDRKVMEEHTVIGARILAEPTSREMKMAKVIALTHHERWDGNGYPEGLAGEEIPLWGRIVALADVMDSLLSSRPYKSPMDFDQVLNYIRNCSGSHFDPALAGLVLENGEIFRDITQRFNPAASSGAEEKGGGSLLQGRHFARRLP